MRPRSVLRSWRWDPQAFPNSAGCQYLRRPARRSQQEHDRRRRGATDRHLPGSPGGRQAHAPAAAHARAGARARRRRRVCRGGSVGRTRADDHAGDDRARPIPTQRAEARGARP